MAVGLLQSELQTLEPPTRDESPVSASVHRWPQAIAGEIRPELARRGIDTDGPMRQRSDSRQDSVT